MLAAAFDRAGANLEAGRAVAVGVHPVLVVREVGDGFLHRLAAGGMLVEIGDHGGELARPEGLQRALVPADSEGSTRRDGMSDRREGLTGMLPVDDLGGAGKVFLGQAPNPLDPIAEDDHRVGVRHPAALGRASCSRALSVGPAVLSHSPHRSATARIFAAISFTNPSPTAALMLRFIPASSCRASSGLVWRPHGTASSRWRLFCSPGNSCVHPSSARGHRRVFHPHRPNAHSTGETPRSSPLSSRISHL